MPGTIGKIAIGGTDAALFRNEALRLAPRLYTAVLGDVVDTVGIYARTTAPPCTFEIGVYVWNGVVPTNRVNSALVICNNGAFAFIGAGPGLAWPLVAGITYCVAISNQAGAGWRYNTVAAAGGQSNELAGGGLPALWVQNAIDNVEGTYFATVIIPAAAGGLGYIPDGRYLTE